MFVVNTSGVIRFVHSDTNFKVRLAASKVLEGGAKLERLWRRQAALRQITRSLAAELLPRGIRVNAVSPGPIWSPILQKVGMAKEAADQIYLQMKESVPMKRIPSRSAPLLTAKSTEFSQDLFVD